MSELTKKLHILKTGGTEETATLYDSTDDCTEPRISFSVDGANAYAKLGATDDENATTFRVYRDSDKSTYAVLKTAVLEEWINATITQSNNQTIHVYTPDEDGVDHTDSFKTAKGTSYLVKTVPTGVYKRGLITAKVSETDYFQEFTFEVGDNGWQKTFTIPDGVNKVVVTGMELLGPYDPMCVVGVTSNGTYTLTCNFDPISGQIMFMSDNGGIWFAGEVNIFVGIELNRIVFAFITDKEYTDKYSVTAEDYIVAPTGGGND